MYTSSYWSNLVVQLIPLADLTVVGAVSYAGATFPIGTRSDPKITVICTNGVLNISGTVDGAGIMIIQPGGQFNPGGNYHFEGLVLGVGDGITSGAIEISAHGTPKISGAVVCVGGGADVLFQGAGGIRYSSEALANLSNLNLPSPVSVVYWREIK